jgi:hypothetical protein
MLQLTTIVLAVLAGTTSAVVQDWQQCTLLLPQLIVKRSNLHAGGGTNYGGDSQCATGSGCVKLK